MNLNLIKQNIVEGLRNYAHFYLRAHNLLESLNDDQRGYMPKLWKDVSIEINPDTNLCRLVIDDCETDWELKGITPEPTRETREIDSYKDCMDLWESQENEPEETSLTYKLSVSDRYSPPVTEVHIRMIADSIAIRFQKLYFGFERQKRTYFRLRGGERL